MANPATATSPDQAVALVKQHLHSTRSLAEDKIEVQLHTTVPVPGLHVFTAREIGGRGPGQVYSAGVVDGQNVVSDRAEAMRLVAKAWGYGPRRTVSAENVASVIGLLEGATSKPKPLVSDKDLAFYQKTARKEYADAAFLPRETEVDGQPAVQYCNTSSRPPFWLATAIFRADGTVEVTRESVAH